MRLIRCLLKKLSNIYTGEEIDIFVKEEVLKIQNGCSIIDIGAGSQQYRKYCQHLVYKSQDFGGSTFGLGEERKHYNYGPIDYLGNAWSINVPDSFFDAGLCTEVLEHLPYPHETIREISRILKPGGKLILTVPLSSIRHFDPHWYTPGFSNNWFEFFFEKYGFNIERAKVIGDYNRYMYCEIYRTMRSNFLYFLLLMPAFFAYRFLNNKNMGDRMTAIGYQYVVIKR